MTVDAARVAGWLDARSAIGDFSGVALVTRDGKRLVEHAAGLASRAHGVPVGLNTRFAVASITKMAVAIAALRLVERGELDLHQPLIEVLPAAHQPTALTPAHTLHHLLSHTSGLADYHDDSDTTWSSFTAAWDRIPTYHVRSPADMLPLFATLPSVRAPGERYVYTDANFLLAGLVLEAVTGQSWIDVVAREVLEPAGMGDTAVEAMDTDPARLAVGYLTDDGPVDRRRTNVFSVTAMGMPDGGMLTTAADLVALVDALLGGRLVGPGTLEAMTTPHAPVDGAAEAYGYGRELAVLDGVTTIIGHGGSDPGVSCVLAHHLAAATTIVVLCNQDRGAWAVTRELTRELGLHDPRA